MPSKKQSFAETIITKLFSRFPSLAERWADSFKAVKSDSVPWTPFNKELPRCRVALVTTAGVHLKNQQAFNMEDEEGDCSFREIPGNVATNDLMITHKYYDHSDADKDVNIVFPIERLKEMAASGEIGGISSRHFGVMGHILGARVKSLIDNSAPLIAARLKEDGADIALLTPGWGTCNQSVGLIQRAVEEAGIPTISISILRKLTEEVKPPRALFLRWPFGHPLGEPGNIPQQMTIMRDAFRYLKEIETPGTIIDLPYKWKREKYPPPIE